MKSPLPIIGGVVVTLVVHGALAGAYEAYRGSQASRIRGFVPQTDMEKDKKRVVLCDDHKRCPKSERRIRRRAPEESPVEDLDVLEAAVIPALGEVEPDPKKLPEIEAYEEHAVVEDGINIDNEFYKPEPLNKGDEPQEAKLDRLVTKASLSELLKDYKSDDPRANRKDLSRHTGIKDGEVGGVGLDKRLGHAYSARASKAIRRVFKVPPFLDAFKLRALSVRVVVSRIGFDGTILAYRVTKKSGDRSYDDAALAAVKQFVGREGGTRKLPAPDTEVLRYINAKGLTIRLEGRSMRQ